MLKIEHYSMKGKIKLYVLLLIKVPNLSILLYLEIFLKMSILLKKMSILLKKTYQNPFVELYYEQKNATQIVCKK